MITSLHDLYIHHIKDLHSAETQIANALPAMIQRASNDELKDLFQEHLTETFGQIDRILEILRNHDSRPGEENCQAIKGIIEEGEHLMDEMAGDAVDAGLIAAAQRVEHYEIAAYGTAKEYADVLGYDDDEKLIKQTLEQEGDTNKKLTKIATGGVFSDGANAEAVVNS
ncbi:MAG: hypothetical protein CMO55_10100 [Verrucomicrobiales bacterium]|nr:hypothetical protein [Verrucomicrobiales bacterium]